MAGERWLNAQEQEELHSPDSETFNLFTDSPYVVNESQ